MIRHTCQEGSANESLSVLGGGGGLWKNSLDTYCIYRLKPHSQFLSPHLYKPIRIKRITSQALRYHQTQTTLENGPVSEPPTSSGFVVFSLRVLGPWVYQTCNPLCFSHYNIIFNPLLLTTLLVYQMIRSLSSLFFKYKKTQTYLLCHRSSVWVKFLLYVNCCYSSLHHPQQLWPHDRSPIV